MMNKPNSLVTHQFTGHSLPGRDILSQVNFPKRTLWHKAGTVTLVGQSPWKQQHVHVDLVAPIFHRHFFL